MRRLAVLFLILALPLYATDWRKPSGGSAGITSGTTVVTGGANGSPCFIDGVGLAINCADTGWGYDKTTGTFASNAVTLAGKDGTDLVTNGTFTGAATGWTLGPGWTYSGNAVNKDGDGIGTLAPTVPLAIVVGTTYHLTFVISGWSVGSVTPSAGGKTLQVVSANGSWSQYFTANATTNLTFTPTNTSRFTIDTVALLPVTPGISTTAGPTLISKSLINTNNDETALKLAYTVNKPSSGNDIGLMVDQIDVASPGTSLLLDLRSNGATKFSCDNTGGCIAASFLSDGSADPADAGFIRAGNNTTVIAAERTPTGTDSYIKFNSSNEWAIGPAATNDTMRIGTGAEYVDFLAGSTIKSRISGGALHMVQGTDLNWSAATVTISVDAIFGRDGAAGAFKMADANSASPTSYQLRIGSSARAGTDSDKAGGNATITTGIGTGTGAGASVIFQTPTTAVGTSNAAQTMVTRATINQYGLIAGGTAPAPSSCGNTPSVAGGQWAGKLTVGGGGAVTSCTLTFATPYANAPACTISGDNTAVTYAATTTTAVLTITSSADMQSDVISYICVSY